MKRSAKLYAAFGTLLLLMAQASRAAMEQQGIEGRPVPGLSQPPVMVTVVTPAIDAQAARDRRRRQEEKLVADIDRMVVLTSQLKAEIDQRTANTLPAGSIKKAQELEKLARGVKRALQE